jgi:ATPase
MIKGMVKFVLDISVIVDGRVTEEIKAERLLGDLFIVPEVLLAELEAHVRRGQETGYAGLHELCELQRLKDEEKINLIYKGPRDKDVKALIYELVEEEEAILVTSDRIQALVGRAKGIAVRFYGDEGKDIESIQLLRYFDEQTMSVHLRARTRPKAKRGTPGKIEIVYLGDEPLTEREVERIAREIVEVAEFHSDGFIEMDSGGSTVVQLKNIRIAIARPPFSDALEITATRPLIRTKLEDYAFADLLKERLGERHRGVLVSGSPGAGKSTFVQAIADYLEKAGWVVKTMEKPRDLEVSEEVTQYTALEGDMANTAEVLLLVRPDYTIFDEMRRTEDFQVFADMRLAGVGMVGVVHAARGIDALQRLIGRVELGMIPQVVDTVVFIEAGDIQEVYEVEFTVKLPSGMLDTDLARPVIEVRDFESKELEYEIYTYGEQVVVMPLKEVIEKKPIWKLAARELEYELGRFIHGSFQVEIKSDDTAIVYIDDSQRPYLIGRAGSRIAEIEREVGLHLEVRPFAEMKVKEAKIITSDRYIILDVDPSLKRRNIEVLVDGERVFIGSASKSGSIKLLRGSKPAEEIYEAYLKGKNIHVRPAG